MPGKDNVAMHESNTKYENGEVKKLEVVDVGIVEAVLKGDDNFICEQEEGLFAVFDGMGGKGEPGAGRIASNVAANICLEKLTEDDVYDIQSLSNKLMETLYYANDTISWLGDMGTTATVFKLINTPDGTKAVWASAGDSRLYLYRQRELTQLSNDEGRENAVSNALGMGDIFRLEQIYAIDIEPHDRFMLCTDGITGDYPEQELTPDEWQEVFMQGTSQQSADMLLQYSKKQDDKTALVFDIGS